jgi:hypothetical protein
VEEGSGPALHASISPIVPLSRGGEGVPRHLLHRRQIHAQIQQVLDPCPAEVIWRGRLDLGIEPALSADPPGGGGAEPSQLIALAEQAPDLRTGQKIGPGSEPRARSQYWRAGRADGGTVTWRGLRPSRGTPGARR